MERASARTMAEEMAARWCGKKDWGEARPSPRCLGLPLPHRCRPLVRVSSMRMLLLLPCASSHGLLAGGRCVPPTVHRAALSLSLVATASTWDDEALGGLSGAMHLAIRGGDAARVRELLDEACAGGDAQSRAALLQPGAVEAGGPRASAEAGPWASALHLAAQYDQPMLVPLLLEAGASTEARDGGSGEVSAGGGGGGATPLMVAAAHGSSRTAAALLAAGADRHAASAAGSVVHVAAAHGSVGVLRLLWDDARTISDVSTPGPGGWPPLHAAALNGQDGATRELLRLGADRALLAHGQTALDVATSDDVRRALKFDGGLEGQLAGRASPLVPVSHRLGIEPYTCGPQAGLLATLLRLTLDRPTGRPPRAARSGARAWRGSTAACLPRRAPS
jgi:hypothetical protein